MQRVLIYKDSKGYIITPVSKTIQGFWTSLDPSVRISANSSPEEVVNEILAALNKSKTNITMNAAEGRINSEYRELGLKSWKELDTMSHCSIEISEMNKLFILPSVKNAPPSKGHSYKANSEGVTVGIDTLAIEVYNAIEYAFSKCE